MVITDLATDEIVECNEQWLREADRPIREEVIGRRLWEFEFKLPTEWRESIRQALIESGRMPAVEVPVIGSRWATGGRNRARLQQHADRHLGYNASLMADLDGELLKDASEIHQAARRSAELTRRLLAFSRRQVLQTEALDSNALVCGLESMLRPLIGESVELRFDLETGVPAVKSDRGQLEQAVVNLVVNARDAMPDGGVLTVQTRGFELSAKAGSRFADLEPGAYVAITVSDEGLGIEPELAEHDMEPFYTTRPAGEGTGLGLPMVHGLARQCGGGLVLESEPGRGTRAHILLPACANEDVTLLLEPFEPSALCDLVARVLLGKQTIRGEAD